MDSGQRTDVPCASAQLSVRRAPDSDIAVPSNPAALESIAARTLDHYNRSAESFWQGTRDHDVSQRVDALLRPIDAALPFTILDFGCGPGRELKVFSDRGHVAIGLEGSERFAQMARGDRG